MWGVSAVDLQKEIQKFHEHFAVVKNKRTLPCKLKRRNGKRKQKAPSPTPNSPVEYKVLSRVTVRIGKSLKSKIIGHIHKGAIVTVNQIKGRRARVIRNTSDGTIQIGQVSLHTSYSLQLLTQFFKRSVKSTLKPRVFLSKSLHVDGFSFMDESDCQLVCRSVIMLPLIEQVGTARRNNDQKTFYLSGTM